MSLSPPTVCRPREPPIKRLNTPLALHLCGARAARLIMVQPHTMRREGEIGGRVRRCAENESKRGRERGLRKKGMHRRITYHLVARGRAGPLRRACSKILTCTSCSFSAESLGPLMMTSSTPVPVPVKGCYGRTPPCMLHCTLTTAIKGGTGTNLRLCLAATHEKDTL